MSGNNKKQLVEAFLNTVLKKRNYEDEEERRARARESGANQGPFVQSVHAMALEHSLLNESCSHVSLLALCGSENKLEDVFEAFGSFLGFVSTMATAPKMAAHQKEIQQLLLPLFVHCFLELILKVEIHKAKEFSDIFIVQLPLECSKEAQDLTSNLLSCHPSSEGYLTKYRASSLPIKFSDATFKYLLKFLETQPNCLLLVILQKYINIEVYSETGVVLDEIDAKKASQKKKDTRNLPTLSVTDNRSASTTKTEGEIPERPLTPLEEFKKQLKEASNLKMVPPSICVYTTDLETCSSCCLCDERSILVGGSMDSSIHVWSLDRPGDIEGYIDRQPQVDWLSILGEESEGATHQQQPNESSHCVLYGHAGPVYGVDSASKGHYLLSASEDTSVRLWDVPQRCCLATYEGHAYPIFDVISSPCDVYFATASLDRTARLWSYDLVYPIRIFAGHTSSVDVIKFHPNSNYLATGSSDKTCRLWDIQSGQCVRLMTGHKQRIGQVLFNADGRSLFTGAGDGTVKQWDIGQGQMLGELRGLSSDVMSLVQSPDGHCVAGLSCKGEVCLWRIDKHPTSETDLKSTSSIQLSSFDANFQSVLVKDLYYTYLNRLVLIGIQLPSNANAQ